MFKKLLQTSIILALVVVILGAYTRLADAGLGCPDWPGCYGQLIVPNAEDGTIIEGYERPLEVAKGWKEMIHRYAAASLGLLIFVIVFFAFKGVPQYRQHLGLPIFTAFFVVLQGLFGMWTVTLMVHPGIVTTHLIGGFLTTILLTWMLLNQSRPTLTFQRISTKHKLLIILTLIVLIIQIALGGWTSTNYAALACGEEFPTCLGSYWPDVDYHGATYWGPIGSEHDYEYGVLENSARAGIQMIHRIGAVITLIVTISMIYSLKGYTNLKPNLIMIATLLTTQVALGILNVLLSLPMTIAVLHNAIALLLLISIIMLIHKVFKVPS